MLRLSQQIYDAIREHGLNPELVEDPSGIGCIFGVRHGDQLTRSLGGQRRPGAHADRLGVRVHVFDRKRVVVGVAGRGRNGVGVVVDGFDFGDLSRDLRIDLELRAGE